MRFLVVALFGTVVGLGQVVVEPDNIPSAQKQFEHRPDEAPLACTVTPAKPAIDFSFRFHSGYTVNIPLKQYSGSGHGFVVLTKVTPEDTAHQPVYLSSAAHLPDVPKSSDEIEVGGSYLLGEGRYTIALLLFDDARRTCRSQWFTEVKLSRPEHNIRPRIPPGSVWPVSTTNLPEPVKKTSTASKSRFTVLLNAAPLHARGTVISPDDRELLLGSLATLLEELPSASVRLVVFNLDQQKKIFADDRFTTANLAKVGESMDQLELASVKYDVLQNTTGHFSLLAGLVKDELKDEERSDAIVFFGPASHYVDPIPRSLLEDPSGPIPDFFYVQFRPIAHLARVTQPMRPPMQRRGDARRQGFPSGGGELPDVIESVTKRLHGKTFKIRTPGEFAAAISDLDSKTAR